MNDTNKTTKDTTDNQRLEKFGLAMFAMMVILSKISWTGLKKIKFKSYEFMCLFPCYLLTVIYLVYKDFLYLRWLNYFFPSVFSIKVIIFLSSFPKERHFYFLTFFTTYVFCAFFGLTTYMRKKKIQRCLDDLGFSTATGNKPQLIEEIIIDDNKSKLIIVAKGIGYDRFLARKIDLEANLERIIESINVTEDRKRIEILMCKTELRKRLPFYEVEAEIVNPYSFLVGESANGIHLVDIRDLPHLLIAGSTGGGKSAFFRQVFVSLLKKSQHLQVYLIDLKRGIEVKEFAQIPNVRIAKDEAQAVQLLQALRDEMQERFIFMEENGFKKIDPNFHERDLIVVGIDEASVLYGKTSVSKAKSELVAKARELTDEISKLARAAGIHLVIATQKPLKESLDTKTLENLSGRMVFKMSTHAGSNTALGNTKAFALPDIKGRGIWAGGNKYIEIQTPYLSEIELDIECKEIAENMKKHGVENYRPMIEFEMLKSENVSAVMSETTNDSQAFE